MSELPSKEIDPYASFVNAESNLVEKFLDRTISLGELKALPPGTLNILKSEAYIPYDMGELSDLDVLISLASKLGRIRISDPSAIQEVYQRFGKRDSLTRTFLEQIGYPKDEVLGKIRQIVMGATSHGNVSTAESQMLVIDRLGTDDSLRAYMWPYIGIQNRVITTEVPSRLEEVLKTEFRKAGIKPWRVAAFETAPGARTQRGATVGVFIGK